MKNLNSAVFSKEHGNSIYNLIRNGHSYITTKRSVEKIYADLIKRGQTDYESVHDELRNSTETAMWRMLVKHYFTTQDPNLRIGKENEPDLISPNSKIFQSSFCNTKLDDYYALSFSDFGRTNLLLNIEFVDPTSMFFHKGISEEDAAVRISNSLETVCTEYIRKDWKRFGKDLVIALNYGFSTERYSDNFFNYVLYENRESSNSNWEIIPFFKKQEYSFVSQVLLPLVCKSEDQMTFQTFDRTASKKDIEKISK